ncbi:ISAs1 family transposase [Paraburkholderia sp. BL6665CI2N2]|uniref:ISAs1 family transposase n=1 Tax=Paraburkholderia sp. BL6665CI2N2 TaxID=1938806 RepID=UPI001FBBB2F6|nr:ISAs1 family transposase [Paraburkholderia sp. BL6665CI2N2]
MQLFDAQRTQPLRSVRFVEHCQTGRKVHGRIETRRCVATDMIDWLDEDGKWAGLRSVAMVEATREIDGRVSLERRYYINSLPADPKRINETVRAHWAIENSIGCSMSPLARINVVPGWTMQHKTSRSGAASCRIYCALTKPPRSA